MIVSASYRTDIPALYASWFRNRLRAGYCRVVNPYGGARLRVSLGRDAVDGFVFWTRNAGPFLPVLAEIADRGFPFIIQLTVTGYPRALDAGTVDPEAAVAQAHDIASTFGRRAVVWRYDPIVFTSATTPPWHRDAFGRLARALAGATDEVVVSFAQIYRKTERNLNRAAARHGFAWWDPEAIAKRALLADLAALAGDRGLKLAICGQRELVGGAARDARCIDPERLSDVAQRPIVAPPRPHRACGCAAARDIGAYDTCAQGCVYCYAVTSREAAKRRLAAHDPDGEFLDPPAGAATPTEACAATSARSV